MTTAVCSAEAEKDKFPVKYMTRLKDAHEVFEKQLAEGQKFAGTKKAYKGEVKEWFGSYDKAWKEVSKCLELIGMQ